ncbi:hypothetical protein AUJ14_02020 [Candidatus Micrarchaeota archaeon CG1_02_55_22]|nr:MAG: hypothetical protein AUJ14_02020 [Candidatus Micrarchaeota archaeon CG1_02_55_22]
MGEVILVMKVFPQEGADPAAVLERVKGVAGFTKGGVEDFVFGTKIVRASFKCMDGDNRDFEEDVKKLEGVSEVQVEEVGLA